MNDSLLGTGKVQDQPGTSHWHENKEVLKQYWGPLKRTKNPSLRYSGQICNNSNIKINNDNDILYDIKFKKPQVCLNLNE